MTTRIGHSNRRAAQFPMPTPNNTMEMELTGINTAATKGDKAPVTAKLNPIRL